MKPPARLKCLPTVPAPVADPRPSSLIDGRNRRKIHIDEEASDKGLNEIDRVRIAGGAGKVEVVVVEGRVHVLGGAAASNVIAGRRLDSRGRFTNPLQ